MIWEFFSARLNLPWSFFNIWMSLSFYLNMALQLTLEQRGGWVADPAQAKIHLWLLTLLSARPSHLQMGWKIVFLICIWFIVGGNSKILFSICSWLNLRIWNHGYQKKKSVYKWTCVAQTRVVQGSTIYGFILLLVPSVLRST